MRKKKVKRECPAKLNDKAGFVLSVLDADGNELDCVGYQTTNPQSMSLEEYIFVSIAESIVYSYRIMQLSPRKRKAYMAHLHDVGRKFNDLITALEGKK